MTPTIEIKNSKELPDILVWGTNWQPEDAIPIFIDKFGHVPSLCWQQGFIRYYPVHFICPSCYERVNKFGPCQACADG